MLAAPDVSSNPSEEAALIMMDAIAEELTRVWKVSLGQSRPVMKLEKESFEHCLQRAFLVVAGVTSSSPRLTVRNPNVAASSRILTVFDRLVHRVSLYSPCYPFRIESPLL